MKSFKCYKEARIQLGTKEVFTKLDQISSNKWVKLSFEYELRWLYNPKTNSSYFFNSQSLLHASVAAMLRTEYPKEFSNEVTLYAGMAFRTLDSKNDFLVYIDHSYEWSSMVNGYRIRNSPDVSMADARKIVRSAFVSNVPSDVRMNSVSDWNYAVVAFTDAYVEEIYAGSSEARNRITHGAENL